MAQKKRKIRATVSNSRAGKSGVFLPEHLDGPTGKAAQMDGLLYTWHCYQADGGILARQSFEEVEDFYYKRNLQDGLYAQNMKYKKKGNYDRIRDIDEYRKSVKTCPESTLYYLGDMYLNAGPDVLKAAVTEFLDWRQKEYPQVVTLDWAVHQEDGAPHVHERHVWTAHDDDGNLIVSQEKALEEMGVPRADEAAYQADMVKAAKIADPKKRNSKVNQIRRYNNRKMTYTEACRDTVSLYVFLHGNHGCLGFRLRVLKQLHDIEALNGADVMELLKYTQAETQATMIAMEEYIEAHGITTVSAFSRAIRYSHPDWYNILSTKSTTYFRSFINGFWRELNPQQQQPQGDVLSRMGRPYPDELGNMTGNSVPARPDQHDQEQQIAQKEGEDE